WDSARRPLRTVKSPQLSLRRVGAKCILPFFPSRRAPPFYISLWDPARRPPRTVKSPLLSLRRVGARCTLFFSSRRGGVGPSVHFFFPEGESWGQVYTWLFPEGFPEGEPDGTRRSRLAPTRRA